jgi:DNA-binding winged helix-turn-helix (wHTH) protein
MGGRQVYRFAEVEVDPAQSCVRRSGRVQYPRSKVFQVFVYLLEHRDRVVTKDELIARVWKGAAVTDDVVFHCIADIRTLCGDTRQDPRFVRTFPGAGYWFVGNVEEIVSQAQPDGGFFRRPGRLAWVAVGLAAALVAVWAVGQGPRTEAPEHGEVAWWRFDEGAGTKVKDSSGRGHDGTLVGGPTWEEGKLGRALRFDGVHSQVVAAGNSRGLPQGNAPRTVTAWVRTAGKSGDYNVLFQYGTQGSPYKRSFYLGLGEDGRQGAGNASGEVRGASRLDDGAWPFAAAAYDNAGANTLRLFTDGALDSTGTLGFALETGSISPWRIGRGLDGGTPFRGLMDDVRVYPRALSAAEVMALYRCSAQQADRATAAGRRLYNLPVFLDGAKVETGPAGELRHTGTDLAGVQLAQSDGTCGLVSLRGADVGQDLRIGVDLMVPAPPGGGVAVAGPSFRGKAAAPGDGIVGGTAAGYWVQLHSTGVVKIRRLNPHQVVAFTPESSGFEAGRFHRLEVTVLAAVLEATLDGKSLEFDQGGRQVRTVAIAPAWEGPPLVGYNQGAAGIAFSAEPRGAATGQQVRQMVIEPLR